MSKRYLIVVHKWFVNSRGFDVHQFDVDGLEAAQDKAYILERQESNDFQSAAAKVIELREGELLPKRTKLTWWERLTGYAVLSVFLLAMVGCSPQSPQELEAARLKPIKIAEAEGVTLWKATDRTFGGKGYVYFTTPAGQVQE
jgi:hypothetical protein